MSERAFDALVTLVWLLVAGLLVLWVAQQAGGAADSDLQLSQSSMVFQPTADIVIGNGPEELVRMSPDGSVRFGPHYTLDETARAFWQSIAHEAPRAVRRACFARLRRERKRR